MGELLIDAACILLILALIGLALYIAVNAEGTIRDLDDD